MVSQQQGQFDRTLRQILNSSIALGAGSEGQRLILSDISAQIDEIFIDSGFLSDVEDMVNQKFNQTLAENREFLDTEYGISATITASAGTQLTDLKTLMVNQFSQIEEDLANRIERSVYGITQGQIDRRDFIEDLTRQFDTINDTYIKTWVDTGIAGFSRESGNIMAQDAGVSLFEYVGPVDGITRPFCRKHTGQKKTLEEWNKLDNGQIGPVSVYCGGYKCRHRLVPVVNEN